MAGLAQKGGAVYAHVRIGQHNSDLLSPRIMAGCADLVLACDAVVAADKPTQTLMTSDRTAVVANANIAPTADFVRNRDFDFQSRLIENTVRKTARANATQFLEAERVAVALLGDSIGANLLLLGAAWQQGHIPLTRESLEAAIRLNNVAIDFNLRAFALGRLLAHDPQAVEAMIAATNPVPEPIPSRTLDELIDKRVADLTAYQNESLAVRYRALVSKARAAGGDDIADSVARSYHKLLAYKDEYEVARLYSDGRFEATLKAQFQSGTPHVWLAPPFLSKTDPATGRPAKRKFGPWIFKAFKLLAGLKGLRGTALDPFGRTEERRLEREDITAYEAEVDRLLPELTPDRLPLAISIAKLPLDVRGFGPVKAEARTRIAAERAQLWTRWQQPEKAKAA
jgi:indolepyruvate ferredoxin oxidoreductase